MNNPDYEKKIRADQTSGVVAPAIEAVRQKLDDIVIQLKNSRDARKRHILLIEMRLLMAELDRLVLDPTRLRPRRVP